MKKEITTSVYTFEDMIRGGALYVDKTEIIFKMVSVLKGQFFCARPRRFGKSLTISTLEAIFKGKRELFRGLAVSRKDYDWQVYPVIHIDFARTATGSQEKLTLSLQDTLAEIGRGYGISLEKTYPEIMFLRLISALYEKTGKGVVILIDEYDKPVTDHLNSAEEAENYRTYMDAFYQVIKGSEPKLRFVFITGVTKFAKVSIFSKLNNLNDISMDPSYAELFGYTQQELEQNFSDYLDDAVRSGVMDNDGHVLDRTSLLDRMKLWYDGFCFSDGAESVYNPVSVGKFFTGSCSFSNYWFNTGTPSFLMKLMKKNHLLLQDISGAVLSEASFDTFDAAELAGDVVNDERIEQMLYQAGYLTLGSLFYLGSQRMYHMNYPNLEVQRSFEQFLLNAYSGEVNTSSYLIRVANAACQGDTKGMIDVLTDFFADFPYDLQIKAEKFYQAVVYMMFRMCGMEIMAEDRTNIGRIDAVLNAGKHLYIIEFELNRSGDEALKQIMDRKYTQKYLPGAVSKGQTVHALGINFSYSDTDRNITSWEEKIIN